MFSKDGTVAFVANSNDTVSVIDVARPVPTLVRTVAIDSTPAAGVHSLMLSADGTRLYVSDSVDRLVRIVDTTATLQRTTVSVAAGATATSILGGVEAANLGTLVTRLDVVGADPSDLVQHAPGFYNPNWKTAPANGTTGVVTYATSSYGVDMVVTGTQYVELSGYSEGNPFLQVFVDDHPLSDPFQPLWEHIRS